MSLLSQFSLFFFLFLSCSATYAQTYPWLAAQQKTYCATQSIGHCIAPPTDYVRVPVEPGSYQEWVRYLPLKETGAPVKFYDGYVKANQADHVAVVDIDVGNADLQQCADAIMRMRGEYLFSKQRTNCIHFDFVQGGRADYARWETGDRPKVKGKTITWQNNGKADSSYGCFRDYMTMVFRYASTISLSKELQRIKNIQDMQIGDVLIEGGSPGHAVMVMDMAMHPKTKKKVFLLAQGYMPAQDFHILRSYIDEELNPWYELNFKDLETPVWWFDDKDLMRFKEE